MAKKPSAETVPEEKKAKKTSVRKTTKVVAKKAKEESQAATTAAIASMTNSAEPKREKKTSGKSLKTPSSEKIVQGTTPAPASGKTPQAEKQPHDAIKIRRESFRSTPKDGDYASQKDDSRTNDGFSQPEIFGGGEDNFNKRNNKRRNRNRNRQQRDNKQDDHSQQSGFDRNQYHKGIDSKLLSKRAWKIFLGEVTEEGLALMDDNTSREAAKRAFRVAEFFMSEEARRKHSSKPQLKEQQKADDPEQTAPEKESESDES